MNKLSSHRSHSRLLENASPSSSSDSSSCSAPLSEGACDGCGRSSGGGGGVPPFGNTSSSPPSSPAMPSPDAGAIPSVDEAKLPVSSAFGGSGGGDESALRSPVSLSSPPASSPSSGDEPLAGFFFCIRYSSSITKTADRLLRSSSHPICATSRVKSAYAFANVPLSEGAGRRRSAKSASLSLADSSSRMLDSTMNGLIGRCVLAGVGIRWRSRSLYVNIGHELSVSRAFSYSPSSI